MLIREKTVGFNHESKIGLSQKTVDSNCVVDFGDLLSGLDALFDGHKPETFPHSGFILILCILPVCFGRFMKKTNVTFPDSEDHLELWWLPFARIYPTTHHTS